MPSFVPIGLKFSTRGSFSFSATNMLCEMSLKVLHGAQRINLATFHHESIASRRAHLFNACRFCGALKYSLFAMVFATRPAIFVSIQAPHAPHFSGTV